MTEKDSVDIQLTCKQTIQVSVVAIVSDEVQAWPAVCRVQRSLEADILQYLAGGSK